MFPYKNGYGLQHMRETEDSQPAAFAQGQKQSYLMHLTNICMTKPMWANTVSNTMESLGPQDCSSLRAVTKSYAPKGTEAKKYRKTNDKQPAINFRNRCMYACSDGARRNKTRLDFAQGNHQNAKLRQAHIPYGTCQVKPNCILVCQDLQLVRHETIQL